MTQEEKAKAYDEALERARKLYNSEETSADVEIACETIFPELAESENERIRQAIIEFFEFQDDNTTYSLVSKKDILAWLEKQGEQKLIVDGIPKATNYDKMFQNYKIHKFNVGDFIANDYCFGKVIEITNDAYLLDTGQGIPFSCEHNAHLWTIEDAKDGDVLVGKIDGDDYILIFKQIKDGWTETYGHYYDAVNRFCVPSQLFCRDYKGTFYPATKEQRDTLMKAMADAGYTFDFEKKELKKNDTILGLLNKMPSCITVDGLDYHFVMKKTIAYIAFYEGEGEEGRDKIIFWMAGDPIELLTAMLEKLKKEGLLE